MCGPLDIQDIKGETDVEAEHGTGSQPDRLINPKEYEPAVLTTKEHRAAELTDTISDPRKLTPVFTYTVLCNIANTVKFFAFTFEFSSCCNSFVYILICMPVTM